MSCLQYLHYLKLALVAMAFTIHSFTHFLHEAEWASIANPCDNFSVTAGDLPCAARVA